ncbi:hypothetical protein DID73_00805 [Candidatus Marinamargulisbacteria bacterium SCGC AG-343-K17]|nr:hypothetical protein DID73_00805 [Candidatus Marinamargulisbacteria bacterium SCGC AG-343-K17]
MTRFHILTIIGLCLLIFGIYIYKDANLMLEKSHDSPYVEQKNNQTTGYENGKKVFDIEIRSVRQNNYQHVLFAKKITNGTVYNHSGKKVINQLQGDSGRINTNIKSIIVTNNIEANIDPTTSTKSIQVKANKFKYSHQKKTAEFYDSSTLTIDDIEINSNNFTYLNHDETLIFESGFQLRDTHSQTTVNRAVININESLIIATNNIISHYKKPISKNDSDQIKALLKHPTTISAKKLMIDFSDNDHSIVTYNQKVIVNQTGKSLASDYLILDFKSDHYVAKNDLKFSFNNLQWLLNKTRTIKNKDIQKILKKQTTIRAELAQFNPKKNTFMLEKNVQLKQKNFKLTCDHLIYDINDEKITMTGNVIIKKYGIEHLNSSKLIVDIKNETFRSDSNKELSEIILELDN